MAKSKKSDNISSGQSAVMANANTTELTVPETMHISADDITEASGEDQKDIDFYNPNKDVMESIYKKRQQQLMEEAGEPTGLSSVEPASDDIPTELSPPEAKVEQTPQPESGSSADSGNTTANAAVGTEMQPPEKVRIKVEGQEMEVPFETLVSLAQKGMSSDMRYTEAARMRDEAQRLISSQTQAQQQMQPQQQNTQPQAILPQDKLQDIVKRINYGSEEEQAKALLDLGASIEAKVRGELNPLPPEQLVGIATKNAVEQVRFEQDQAIVASEFNDIFKDSGLSMLAGYAVQSKAQEYAQKGIVKTRLDVWREALGEVRNKYTPQNTQQQSNNGQTATTVQSAQPVVTNMEQKVERKRAAPKMPESANKVASSNIAPQYGANASDIVSKMRSQRGQPV